MKKIIAILIIAVFVVGMTGIAYAGWKESYRTKYSKKTLTAEEAERLKHLCDPDLRIIPFKKKADVGGDVQAKPKKSGSVK